MARSQRKSLLLSKNIIIFSVLAIALALLAYFKLYQSDTTEGWSTYTDNQFFQIKYPPNWILNNKPGSGHAGFYIEEPISDRHFQVVPYLSDEDSKSYVDFVEIFNKNSKNALISRDSLDKNGIHFEMFSDGLSPGIKSISISKGRISAGIYSKMQSLEEKSEENKILNNLEFINEAENNNLAIEAIPQLKQQLNAKHEVSGLRVSIYTVNNDKYITGSYGGDAGGGNGFLAMKLDNTWKLLQTGQQAGTCDSLKQYNSFLDENTLSELRSLKLCYPQ